PATEVEVVALRSLSSGDIDVTLRQVAGRTWHVVTHQQTAEGKYVVTTATSSTQVAGTAFQVKIDAPTGVTTVMTTDGMVRTTGGGEGSDNTVSVPAGSGTIVTKGAKPQTPIAMPQTTVTFDLD